MNLFLFAALTLPAQDGWSVVRGKCQSCHRPGTAAPFALASPKDARHWSESIREAVEGGRMPPWHADPKVGRFKNDRSLSPGERSAILAWLDAGCPGEGGSLPPARRWRVAPDRVVPIPAVFHVPAAGTVRLQRFRVPSGFKEAVWVRGVEVRPGNPALVHHIFLWSGRPGGHGENLLGSYLPGDEPGLLPEGYARRVPADADLVFEVHYTPNGKPGTDRSEVGLVFAEGPVRREVRTCHNEAYGFTVPAGEPSFPVPSARPFYAGNEILAVTPHMHLRGKAFRADLLTGGKRTPLLSVPRYDFNWQTCYELAEPFVLTTDGKVECVGTYDNSTGNPNNPDPSRPVRQGGETTDEMMVGLIDYAVPVPAGTVAVAPRSQSRALVPVILGLVALAGAALVWRRRSA